MINTYKIQQNTIFQYCILIILLFFVSIFFYIKLAFPFWNSQPVYHIYDYWRMVFREPGIIREDYPSITKYCNFNNITTFSYQDLNESQIKKCIDLLQTQYLKTDDSVYVFNSYNLDSYMTGHKYSSYISIILDSIPTYINDHIESNKIILPKGIITSRSIRISGDQYCYYWDFICTHRELETRNKKAIYELIQTHNYRTRILNPDIKFSLFKRIGKEAENYQVVPVVKFSTISYRIDSLNKQPHLPKYFIVVDINRTNISDVLEFLDLAKCSYNFWALSDNLEMIYGYMILKKGEIMAVYFFRDSRIFIENHFEYEEEKGGSLLELVASMNHTGSHEVFYNGFLHALFLLLKKYPVYNTIMIECIGDNHIINTFYPNEKYLMNINGGYYFYNYFYKLVHSSQCFILL
jgi:hypothetical protein